MNRKEVTKFSPYTDGAEDRRSKQAGLPRSSNCHSSIRMHLRDPCICVVSANRKLVHHKFMNCRGTSWGTGRLKWWILQLISSLIFVPRSFSRSSMERPQMQKQMGPQCLSRQHFFHSGAVIFGVGWSTTAVQHPRTPRWPNSRRSSRGIWRTNPVHHAGGSAMTIPATRPRSSPVGHQPSISVTPSEMSNESSSN